MRHCSFEDCPERIQARGWCGKHYRRWQRHGDPATVLIGVDDEARFWSHVDAEGDCWEWTVSTGSHGYGQFAVGGLGGTMVLAHRYAFELLVGPIPEGLTLDHLCRNKICVNPDHLEPVTLVLNGQRARLARVA